MDLLYPEDGTDAMLRVACAKGKDVFFTGHYRNTIDFRGNKILNDGRHMLFMMQVD